MRKTIKNIIKNKFILCVFSFPVFMFLFLSAIGYWFSHHPIYFKDIGIHKHETYNEYYYIDAVYPELSGKPFGNVARIVSYTACVFPTKASDGTIFTMFSCFYQEEGTPSGFKKIVSEQVKEPKKSEYLRYIPMMTFLDTTMKILVSTPLEFHLFIGVILGFARVWGLGRRIFLVWWWYNLFLLPTLIGFRANYLEDFNWDRIYFCLNHYYLYRWGLEWYVKYVYLIVPFVFMLPRISKFIGAIFALILSKIKIGDLFKF